MNDSHKHNVEQKKSETKELILHDFIHIKFKTRQNKSVILEVSKVIPLGSNDWKEKWVRELLGSGHVLSFYLDAGYIRYIICENLTNCKVLALSVCMLHFKSFSFKMF